MRLVVDANILFSAILKDSLTRKLVCDETLELFAPKFLLIEFAKYSAELQKKSRLSTQNFLVIAERLIKRVRVVSDEEIMLFFDAAQYLVSDSKDAPYAACALAVNADVWSNDRHFANSRIKAWTTKQLLERFYYAKRSAE